MIKPLAADQLYTTCDLDQFDFETTDQLDVLEEVAGQDRALKALQLGVNIRHDGYNLFVLGPTGLGKHTVVRDYLDKQSQTREMPPDWVYVNNFDKPSEPISISLTSEHATIFRQDMHQLVEDLCSAIPSAFETDEYHLRLQEIDDDLKKTIESAFSTLNDEAEASNMRLLRTPHGFAFAPVKDNEVIKPKEFDALPEKEQQRIEKAINTLEEKLTALLRMQPQWQREARNRIKELNREIVMFASGHLIDELKNKYQYHPVILKYWSPSSRTSSIISRISAVRKTPRSTCMCRL